MMQIENITLAHPLWDEVWALYEGSFPEYERRRAGSHERAAQDPRFRMQAGFDDQGALLGLLFWWQGEGVVYVEHLAVVPRMRGHHIGSRLLGDLLERCAGQLVVLEIDPPVDEISMRRLRFYENLGLRPNPQTYVHHSYARGGQAHPLVLLSWPDLLTSAQIEDFIAFIHDSTLRYKD